MASKHPSQGGEVANGGGVPSPGAFVTPQAGSGVERMDIQKFFDPSTYRGKSIGLPPLGPSQPMTDLTPENLRRFFDPATYHGKMVCLPPMCTTFSRPGLTKERLTPFFDPSSSHGQKRPAESAPVHPASRARMGKFELVEKFKLAAELNGVNWNELVVPHLGCSTSMFVRSPPWILIFLYV